MSKERVSWGDIEEDDDTGYDVILRDEEGSAEGQSNSNYCCSLIYDLDEHGHNEVAQEPMSYLLRSVNALSEFDYERPVECSANQLINACSVAVIATTRESLSLDYKKLFADYYLRYRHELFCNIVSLALDLNVGRSDVAFSSVLPVQSKRTPDFIRVEGMKVIIIEATVTSDYQGALFRKGSVEHGYQSKYADEINELILLGYDVDYKVLIYDVSEMVNKEYLNVIRDLSSLLRVNVDKYFFRLLEDIRLVLIGVHYHVSKNFSGEMSLILSQKQSQIMLKEEHLTEINKYINITNEPTDETYIRLTVSVDVYSKLLISWERLAQNIRKWVGSKDIIIVYNPITSRFALERGFGRGVSYNSLSEAIAAHDRITVVLNTHIRSAGKLKECYKYDSGIDFYVLQTKTSLRLTSNRQLKNYFFNHPNKMFGVWPEYAITLDKVSKFSSAFYNREYEASLINKICDFDSKNNWSNLPDVGKSMLVGCTVSDEERSNALEKYKAKLFLDNDFDEIVIPPRVYKFKNSFLYPIVDSQTVSYGDFRKKPDLLIKRVLEARLKDMDYSNEILHKASFESFEFGSLIDPRLLTEEYSRINSKKVSANTEYYIALKQIAVRNDLRKLPKLSEAKTFDPDISIKYEAMKSCNQVFEDYLLKKKLPRHKLPLIKLPTRPKSQTRKDFDVELSHFKVKGVSKNEGYGMGLGSWLPNLLNVNHSMSLLESYLSSASLNKTPDNFIDTFVADDVSFIKLLKEKHVSDCAPTVNKLMNTNLAGATSFISRLCHTLMYYSQCSFSSEYVAIDNLGYNNVLLWVKGGKKIFRTKMSKMYRLIYPVNQAVIPFITDNSTSSYIIRDFEGVHYCITPWSFMHEANVAEGISFHHRISGFLLMNLTLENYDQKLCYLLFNVILAFHGRRSTEELLHGVRYFIANNFGSHSNLVDLMESFSSFNRDIIQFYLRGNLIKNYENFGKKMSFICDNELKDLRHIFTNHAVKNVEDITYMIYATYLMVKAPINQVAEQVKNLSSIMKIHEEVAKLPVNERVVNISNSNSLDEYASSLFSDDMKVDLELCSTVGKFCADYLLSKNTESKLLSEWEKILSKGWQTLANTRGLRGEKEKGQFFGQKGYYVMLDKLYHNDRFTECLGIINNTDTELKKRKQLKTINETYKEKLLGDPEELNFHAVDKRQRGGSREIYVMDLITKTHQQPIEKFMQKLCRHLPNEVISVPSNKRAHLVHNKVFEKKHSEFGMDDINYLTLDCRKWAPKSLIEKYVVFIAAMSEALPDEFLKHFMRFFNLMFTKKLVTRKYILDVFLKSERNKKYGGYFEVIDDRASMTMDYSFMMGIFNYLSSLMHAANQLYAAYIINKTSTLSYGVPVDFTLLCHSDDSAGRLVTQNSLMTNRALFLYELLLKGCNHLLSIKKCVVSKVYFEFLSIFYFKKRLLPLLPKFLSGINFRPTDKGFNVDILSAANRSNELILNGSWFSNAYISFKIQSHMIWKFYFNRDPLETDYNRPTNMMGMPDSHPLSVMLLGGDSEMVRILSTKGPKQYAGLVKILNILSSEYESEDSVVPVLKTQSRLDITKPLIKKMLEDLSESIPDFANSWTIANVNFKNTYLESIQMALKCKDKTFLAAMQDEELIRRISRSYHFRTTSCVSTKFGLFSYKELISLIDKMVLYIEGDGITSETLNEVFGLEVTEEVRCAAKAELELDTNSYLEMTKIMHGEYINFLKYMDKLSVKEINLEDRHNTCKPVHMNIVKTTRPLVHIPDVSSLVSYVKEPNYSFTLPDLTNMPSLSNIVTTYFANLGLNMDRMSATILSKLLNKLNSSANKDFYFYSNMPSNDRDITNYHDLCAFLAHNSFDGKQILGISLYFPTSLRHISPEFIASMMTDDFKLMTSFLSVCVNLFKHNKEEFYKLCQLEVNGSQFGLEEVCVLQDLIHKLKSKWVTNANTYGFIAPYFEMLTRLINGSINVTMDGDLVGSLDFLNDSYYFCYLKKQKFVNNKWVGEASVYCRSGKMQVIMSFNTNMLKDFKFYSHKGPVDSVSMDYINYVLRENGMRPIHDYVTANNDLENYDYVFGVDDLGVFQIAKSNNLPYVLPMSKYDPSIIKEYQFEAKYSCQLIDSNSILITSGDELLNFRRSKLNFMKLDISRLQEMFNMTFMATEKNSSITNSISGPLIEHFRYYVYRKMGMDLSIPFDDFLNNMVNSKMYRMLHHLEIRNLLIDPEERVPHFPAQEGGQLHLMLLAKKTGFDIDMIDETNITSTLMDLKTTHPESYMSTIYSKINEMYESLYSDDMKESIAKELSNIYGAIVNNGDDSDQRRKLGQLLTKWGIVGIEGHLTHYKAGKTERMFDYFQVTGNVNTKNGYLSSKLPVFLASLKSVIDDNKGHAITVLQEIGISGGSRSYEKFSECFNTAILSIVTSLNHSSIYTFHNHPYSIQLINASLSAVLDDADLSQTFSNALDGDELLSVLPVSSELKVKWYKCFTSLLNAYLVSKPKQPKNPFTKSDERWQYLRSLYLELSGDKKYSNKIARYCGVYDADMIYNLKHRINVKVGGKTCHIAPRLSAISNVHIIDIGNMKLEGMLSRTALDADSFMDLTYEVKSNQPDIEFVNESWASIMEEAEDELYVNNTDYSDGRVDTSLTIVNLIGGWGTDNVKRIRQTGENIMVITDHYLDLNFTKFHVGVYNPGKIWQFPIMARELVLIYLLCDFKLARYFEVAYDLKRHFIKKIPGVTIISIYHDLEIDSMEFSKFSPEKMHEISLSHQTDNDSWEIMLKNLNDEMLSPDEPAATVVRDKDLTDLCDKLSSLGVDPSLANKINFINKKRDSDRDNFEFVLEYIFEEMKSKGEIADIVKSQVAQHMETGLKDKEVLENIVQIPLAFRQNHDRYRGEKNLALKDEEIRAELNSLSVGLADRIMSGNMTIDQETWEEMWSIIDLCKSQLEDNVENYTKNIFIDITSYILNDAFTVQSMDQTDVDMWTNIRRKLLKVVSSKRSKRKMKTRMEPGNSIMRYNLLGI